MFYNYLIFNMVTLSLRILLKYCVSRCKSSRFKEESVNFASWIKEEASSAEEQLDQAIDSCTTLK